MDGGAQPTEPAGPAGPTEPTVEADQVVDLSIVLTPLPGRQQELAELVARNVARTIRRRVGCLDFSVQPRPDGTVLFLTRWASEEAILAHAGSLASAEHLESMTGLMAKPMQHRIHPPRPRPASS